MRIKRRLTLAGAVVALVLATGAGCNPAGTVVDRQRNCQDTGRAEICNYRLKTSEWFDVAKQTYERCSVGEHYPECGDTR